MNQYIELIKELSEVEGIAAHEGNVRQIFEREAKKNNLTYTTDRLGGIAIQKNAKQSGAYTVMLASHMDEIGFMIIKVEKYGFLRIKPIGGWWEHVLLGQRLCVTTQDGRKYIGIVGSVPPHLISVEERKSVKKVDTLFLDLGFESDSDVFKAGVELGNMVTPVSQFEQLASNENRYIGKAFDDRVGCAVNLAVMNELSKEDINVNVVFAGTVQEEVGLRGAKVTSQTVEADLSIILDCGITGDFPGSPQEQKLDKLGDGVAISLLDGTFIGHPKWRKYIEAYAREAEIPYQNTVMVAGGSDGGPIHTSNQGVPSVYMGTPVRYIHAHNGMIDIRDFEAIVQLIVGVVKELNSEVAESLFGV